jgi:hypothetical protein
LIDGFLDRLTHSMEPPKNVIGRITSAIMKVRLVLKFHPSGYCGGGNFVVAPLINLLIASHISRDVAPAAAPSASRPVGRKCPPSPGFTGVDPGGRLNVICYPAALS